MENNDAESEALDVIATVMEIDVRWRRDGIPVEAKWAAYKALCKAVRREVKRRAQDKEAK